MDAPLALITGGARRLGRSLALALGADGYRVVIHYGRSRADAEAVVAELEARGTQAWALAADLDNRDEVAGILPRVVERAGAPDLLINNASAFGSSHLLDLTPSDLDRNLQINAIAPLCLARDVAAQGNPAHIINLLDTRVVDYDREHAAYHVSKRTLLTLTRMLALELAPRVRVNAVAPGLVLPPEGQDITYLDTLAQTIPLRTHGGANDVVTAVRFLIAATFTTGQVIYIDGGQHMQGTVYE